MPSNLSIPLPMYIAAAIATGNNGDAISLRSTWDQWKPMAARSWQQVDALVETLDGHSKIEGTYWK